jgi:hypothetical protein
MRAEIYSPEYAPTSVLPIIFGMCENWFLNLKKEGILREKIHYFYPVEKTAKSKSTKRAMLWKIDALRQFIEGNQVDDELAELLKR